MKLMPSLTSTRDQAILDFIKLVDVMKTRGPVGADLPSRYGVPLYPPQTQYVYDLSHHVLTSDGRVRGWCKCSLRDLKVPLQQKNCKLGLKEWVFTTPGSQVVFETWFYPGLGRLDLICKN